MRTFATPPCRTEFRGLDSDASVLYLLAGGALELLDCLVRSLKAFIFPDVNKERERPVGAGNFSRPAFLFVASPRIVSEPFGAITVCLELLFRVLSLRCLPLDLKPFRDWWRDCFALFALLSDWLRALGLRRARVASASVARKAFVFDSAEASLGLGACADNFSESDFDAPFTYPFAGEDLYLIARFVL